MIPQTLEYRRGRLRVIDQRALPQRLVIKECRNLKDIYKCIKTLTLRGAPAIGVFAAYGLYVSIKDVKTRDPRLLLKKLMQASRYIKRSRPTAINLSWALERMKASALNNREKSVKQIKDILLKEAVSIHAEDKQMCDRIGKNGSSLIKSGDRILTHCNAGSLATAGAGTALSIIYTAKKQKKRIKVYADETRPLLQGARLTTWELKKRGIDVTLICDNMSATLMRQKKVDKIIVGADRIARNGDFANKIGTYNLAVLAKAHKIPFYVAAPSSTIDFKMRSGREIPIEERDPQEVRKIGSSYIAPKDVKAYNPAFDITPNRLVTAIITERGVFNNPFMGFLRNR